MMSNFDRPWNSFLQEECLASVLSEKKHLSIGIPMEHTKGENRIALTPEAVNVLTLAGHRVLLESGAGTGAQFTDHKYSEAGAEISDTGAVYQCDYIVKVQPLSSLEIKQIKAGATVCSLLSFRNTSKSDLEWMMQKKITAIAYELIEDEYQLYPWIESLSEMDGIVALNVMAELLSSERNGKGVLLGGVAGVPPTDLVIVGAEAIAMVVARVALSMGVSVKIFDSSVAKLRRIEETLNQRVYTSTFHPNTLLKALRTADGVIGCMRTLQTPNHFIVPSDYVMQMKKGSVIIDLNTDLYGCFETSEYCSINDPLMHKNGVLHYCNAHLSTRIAKTASITLSNLVNPLLLRVPTTDVPFALFHTEPSLLHCIYLCQGVLTNPFIGGHYSLPFRDIDLFYSRS